MNINSLPPSPPPKKTWKLCRLVRRLILCGKVWLGFARGSFEPEAGREHTQHVVAARGTGRFFSSLQERNGMCYYLDGVRGCAAVLHSFEFAKAAVACHHRTLNL